MLERALQGRPPSQEILPRRRTAYATLGAEAHALEGQSDRVIHSLLNGTRTLDDQKILQEEAMRLLWEAANYRQMARELIQWATTPE